MEKKISIIIPCYNVEKYIDRCVQSLVSQTIGVDSLELIFVDDASTDSTVEKLVLWEKQYPESILVVTCEENGRQGKARNIGFQYASAEYISYVDSDDWVELDMFQEMYQKAIASQAEVVACGMARDCGDGKLFDVTEICNNKEELMYINTVHERHKFLQLKFGPVVAKLYKKSFLIENEIIFPEGLAYEDNYFGGLVAYSVISVYIINKIFYHYFSNTQSTVTQKNALHHLDRLEIEIRLYEEFCNRGYGAEFLTEMNENFLRRYYLNSLHLLFMRFSEVPYDVLNQMRQEVLQRFPDYKESAIYQQLPEISKGFCLTLEADMTKERWDNLASNYRYLVEKNGSKI